MMCQYSFTVHFHVYNGVRTRAFPSEWAGPRGKLALPNPGVCHQYVDKRVKMSFVGKSGRVSRYAYAIAVSPSCVLAVRMIIAGLQSS